MKRAKTYKNSNAIIIAAAILLFSVSTAWAALSLVKPDDATDVSISMVKDEIPAILPQSSKSHAPEPPSAFLYATGFLGMLVTFVRRRYDMIKRLMDVTGAGLGLVILSPLFLLVAALVKLTSKGPIFYKQTRVGKNGVNFEIYKFRTMKTDAEKGTGAVWARANDSRLTPVGGFLRKAHLDEIPQFINVLKGEMSLIGPRPERPVFVEQFSQQICDYEKRLNVKPGITGLAQVFHRYDQSIDDVKKKIKYDILYIKRMCLWTDIRIAFRTVRVMMTGEGAC
ncbi:MAG: sugar transferase [Candidatus Omnitrophica bacterium]|nr:sugar transferase [Candidatus Omnitrophota bacterium]